MSLPPAPTAPVQRWSTAAHPFHQRWCAGALTGDDLRASASEHHHAVLALARAARSAAELAARSVAAPSHCGDLVPALRRAAVLRERELDLWYEFAAAVGWRGSPWCYAEDPLPETVACARDWVGDGHRDLAEQLATIHAIESIQARLAPVQRDALIDHYGLRDPRAIGWFRRRCERASAGAALAHEALERLGPQQAQAVLRARGPATLRSYVELLDGVERLTSWRLPATAGSGR